MPPEEVKLIARNVGHGPAKHHRTEHPALGNSGADKRDGDEDFRAMATLAPQPLQKWDSRISRPPACSCVNDIEHVDDLQHPHK